jgi:gliding motility-associated-like protein
MPDNTDIVISPNTDYQYNVDSSRIIFNPIVTTTYTITGAERGLCTGKDTLVFTIEVVPFPIADFTLAPVTSLTTEPLITLTNASTLAASYEWIYNQLVFATSTDATYNATDSGEYCFTLIAYNTLGCSDTDTNCAYKLNPDNVFVPSVFSPNGDLKNDEFKIIASNITLKSFAVYDRWGEEVFSTKDQTKGWNGQYKGKDCEIGTYYYYIEYDSFKGKKTLKGDINLVR